MNSRAIRLTIISCLMPMSGLFAATHDSPIYAVFRLDLTQVNVDAIEQMVFDMSAKTFNDTEQAVFKRSLKERYSQIIHSIEAVRDAGAKQVYAVFDMRDFPFFFLALDKGTREANKALSNAIQTAMEDFDLSELAHHSDGHWVWVGIEQTLARLKAETFGQWSKPIQAGLEACPKKALQMVLVPVQDQRRILSEMISDSSSTLDWVSVLKS